MKARKSNKTKMTRFSIASSVISIFMSALLFLVVSNASKTTSIITSKSYITRGDRVTEDQIQTIKVGSYGLSNTIIQRPEEAIDKFALRDIPEGEYVFSTSLTNDYKRRLSDKARYGAIAVPTNVLGSVAADVRENDFVGVLISLKDDNAATSEYLGTELPQSNTALIYSDDLVAVRVLGLYDNSARVAGDSSSIHAKEDGNFISPSMIVFDALPSQRILLNQAMDNGSIRLIIHPEYMQREFRQFWGLTPDGADKEMTDEELQELMDNINATEKGHAALSEKYSETVKEEVDSISEEENLEIIEDGNSVEEVEITEGE